MLPLCFFSLFGVAVAASFGIGQEGLFSRAQKQSLPAEAGSFPDKWIFGIDCETEPKIQVHAYNDDLYILRQGKCSNFEAPFLYLLFGTKEAILLDTGADSSSPVQPTVQGLVDRWKARNGIDRLPLTVTHTHGHGDHVQSDNQFVGMPDTTVIGVSAGAVREYWGFDENAWPNTKVTRDLGGRVIDVLPSPGHHPVSITVYDRRTQLLLTGDIVYPGHLFIFSALEWFDFKDSIDRLVKWTENNPVKWVVGCHVEFSATAFESYPYGTPIQANEHTLHLEPEVLLNIQDAHQSMGGIAQCRTFENFEIRPVYKCGFN